MASRGNDRFDPGEWADRFPLSPVHGHYAALPMTGPADICNNLQLRRELREYYEWGPAVPVDVFVMAEGEPERRHATKIGGIPYRAAREPWPTDKAGEPLLFLAQFNFRDSRDIVGELPGDLLLVFVDGIETLHTEWQTIGRRRLIQPNDVPPHHDSIAPLHGYRFRSESYPEAKFATRYRRALCPTCRGKEVWADHLLPQWQASQIGRAPFFIQERDRQMPGTHLCTISAAAPNAATRYPFLNRPRPLPARWGRLRRTGRLRIGDSGAIYLTIDGQRRIHWRCSSF